MNDGEMTANIDRHFLIILQAVRKFFFHHGALNQDDQKHMGVIRAWFGHELTRETLLADLDIAVLAPQSNYAPRLIDIEENISSPRKNLGDNIATWIAELFTFRSASFGCRQSHQVDRIVAG